MFFTGVWFGEVSSEFRQPPKSNYMQVLLHCSFCLHCSLWPINPLMWRAWSGKSLIVFNSDVDKSSNVRGQAQINPRMWEGLWEQILQFWIRLSRINPLKVAISSSQVNPLMFWVQTSINPRMWRGQVRINPRMCRCLSRTNPLICIGLKHSNPLIR